MEDDDVEKQLTILEQWGWHKVADERGVIYASIPVTFKALLDRLRE